NRIVELSGNKAVSLAGKTSLMELVCIIRKARFMITNDTGPMHIAAALSIPVYAIFGPTSETLTGPYGNGHKVFKADIDCAPCFRKNCDDVQCMKGIESNDVLQAILGDINGS
ncbi:MAG TPA: glycosyltransferase family 9 protein, partial [Nitrospirae bacterium]|nr:glycosyltransferase family 9 protein [Nitrospirota bacterium]